MMPEPSVLGGLDAGMLEDLRAFIKKEFIRPAVDEGWRHAAPLVYGLVLLVGAQMVLVAALLVQMVMQWGRRGAQ